MNATSPTFWEKEPAIIVGFAVAILSAAASFGLHVSNEQIGGITAAITAVMALIGSFVIRGAVNSPATVAKQQTAVSARLEQASAALTTAGGPPAALPCPAVPMVPEPVRDPATGWPVESFDPKGVAP